MCSRVGLQKGFLFVLLSPSQTMEGSVMWRMVFVTFAFLGCLPLLASDGFTVGDTVVLVERKKADGSELGIPAHAQVGQGAVTEHIPSGSSGKILELGTGQNGYWLKIQVGTKEHWIVSKYVANVLVTEETSSGYVSRVCRFTLVTPSTTS
jgi:hypothetical protein